MPLSLRLPPLTLSPPLTSPPLFTGQIKMLIERLETHTQKIRNDGVALFVTSKFEFPWVDVENLLQRNRCRLGKNGILYPKQ